MQIAKYFASLGFEVDTRGIKKFDKALDDLDKKLSKFNNFGKLLNFSINPKVDQKNLEHTIRTALDVASNRVTFEISRFSVNQRALQSALMAVGPLGIGADNQPNTSRSPSPEQLRRQGIRNAEFDRQEKLRRALADRRFGLQGQRLDLQAARLSRPVSVAAGTASGRSVGGMPSLFGPAIALGLGGYGLSSLNKRNQEVVAAQLQTQAVLTGNGGTAEQGEQSFQFLRNTANRVGFNYLEASGDYNVLTSNILGAGGTVGQAQNIFKGFAEYGRVNKLSPARQKLVFNALSQIAGKDKLQAEELTKQLGNSLPGAKTIFAQAYQQMLKEKGKGKGDLTGSAAIIALEADMKKGLVRGDILNYAANIASEKSQPGLVKASQASQAEQARYQNSLNDLSVVASDAGVEEGFARIFRTLSAGLSESGDLVKKLAEGFNEATKWADDLLLWPQDFIRALEGRDSVVADWLGKDNAEQLKKDWKDIKQIFTDISAIKFDFLPDLKSTSEEVAKIMNAIAEFQRWKSGTMPTKTTELQDIPDVDPFGLGSYKSPVGVLGAVLNNTGVNLNRAKERQQAIYGDPSSIFYHNPTDYDDNQKNMAMDMAKEQATSTVTSNQFDISINVDPVTLSQMDVKNQAEDLGHWFRAQLEQASVNFPVKE